MAQGVQVSFALPRIPDRLAEQARLDPRMPLPLFERPHAQWGTYIDPLLDRLGQSVLRWQVGEPSWAEVASLPTKTSDANALLGALRKAIPGPIVSSFAAPDHGPDGDLGETGAGGFERVLPVPAETSSFNAIELAHAWADESRPYSLTFALEPTSKLAISRRDDASRLVKQMVAIWSVVSGMTPRARAGAHAPALALAQPWEWRESPGLSEKPEPMPQAALAAWRIAAEHLQGRRVLGSFSEKSGISCWILGPASGEGLGALVAWRDRPDESGKAGKLEAYHGPQPVRVFDLFGNESLVAPQAVVAQRGEGSIHRINVGDEPVFIEGVDTGLARFVAGFSIEPTALASTGLEQPLSMNIFNPWPVRITGQISVLEPVGATSGDVNGWRILPRVQTFTLDPGQRVSLPLSVVFSDVEEAGPHPFVAEVVMLSGREDPPLRVHGTIDVTLAGLYLDVSQRQAVSTRGNDLIVETQITNRNAESATLSVGVYAPGLPRQRASVTDLQPGATTTRRFVFPGAATSLRGQRVSVGVQQVERPGRLNKSLLIE
jgi:hypothetical protein